MGPPPVTFLGYPDMAPYMYSQVLDQKPIKLQKGDEKWKYHEKDYVPVYTFSSKDMVGIKINFNSCVYLITFVHLFIIIVEYI